MEKHDFRWLPFAYWLKKMIFKLLVEAGYREEDAIRYLEVDKHIPLDRIPGMPTSRYLMQTLATEWGRNIVHVNLWAGLWENFARAWSRSGVSIVADDMRFPNEAEAIRLLGGKLWRVERPGAIITEDAKHMSEGRLNSLTFNRLINNDGDVRDLYCKVEKCLKFTRTGVLEV